MPILRSVPKFSDRYPIRRVLEGPREASTDYARARALLESLILVSRTFERLCRLGVGGHTGAERDDLPFLVGVAGALGDGDWSAADARTSLTWALARGAPLEEVFHHVFATGRDASLGHSSPGAYADAPRRILPPGAAPAAHLTQATGVAWGMRLTGAGDAVLALFGAESASEPDLHHALNFAGVFRVPMVFVARSSPRRRGPDGAETMAQKAAAYGLPAERVDGGDPIAALEATDDALSFARAGGGPALLEILDVGPPPAAACRRLTTLLTEVQLWDIRDEEALSRQIDAALDAAEAAARSHPPPDYPTLFQGLLSVSPK